MKDNKTPMQLTCDVDLFLVAHIELGDVASSIHSQGYPYTNDSGEAPTFENVGPSLGFITYIPTTFSYSKLNYVNSQPTRLHEVVRAINSEIHVDHWSIVGVLCTLTLM